MTQKTLNRIIVIGFAAVILSGVLFYATEADFFFYLALAACAAVLVVDIIFHRCPHCGKHLGRGSVTYCPHCGGTIDQ